MALEFGADVNSTLDISNSHLEKNRGSDRGAGIYLSNVLSANIFQNYFISDTANHGGGIFISGGTSEIQIINNTFNYCRAPHGSAISSTAGNTSIISNNSIFYCDASFGSSYGGAINCESASPDITYNTIAFCDGYEAAGIRLVSSHSLVENNTITNCNGNGIFCNSTSAPTLYDNIISYCSGYGTYNAAFPDLYISYACIWDNELGTTFGPTDIGDNVVFEDPQFCDTMLFNYNLSTTSPCIASGYEGDNMGANNPGCTVPTVVLLSPEDEEVLLTHMPVFYWTIVEAGSYNEYNYCLFIDDNPAFTSADSVVLYGDTSYITTEPLENHGSWWWKVRAFNDTVVCWSNDIYSFRIDYLPLSPVVLSPNNGQETRPNDFLIWTESYDADIDDALTYIVEIDDSFDFLSPEVTETDITSEVIPPISDKSGLVGIQLMDLGDFINLLDDTEYFWRVKAVDKFGGASGFTDGTAHFIFNNSNSVPNPPTSGFAPSEQRIINNLLPTISWYPGTDPDPSDDATTLKYYLHLDDDGEFDTTIQYTYETLPGITSFFVSDSLTDETLWYYAIQTMDDEGAESGFSITQAFWTNSSNDGPVEFSLLSPGSGWLYEMLPTFTWNKSTDSDPMDSVQYSFFIALDENFNFANETTSINDTIHIISDSLEFSDEYWWKVKAYDTFDSTIWSSEVFHILTWVLGDANTDGQCNVGDAVFLINFIFNSGPSPEPLKTGDINGDCSVNIGDAVYIINYVFKGGASPLIGCARNSNLNRN
jgi:parallel beta-helix repeat protein